MPDQKKRSLKFGILGCSRIAEKSVIPAIQNCPLSKLEIIGSRSHDKAREFASQFSCNSFGTYDDVIENKGVDVVYISLPNALHEEWSIKAMEKGKHVLCEKPAALSYDSAKRMVATARKNKVRLLEGLMFRYHPQHAKAKELIKNGFFGDLLKFEGCFATPDQAGNILNSALGGGAHNNPAPYPIYASRMIFEEEPISIVCHLKMDAEKNIDVKSDMILEFSNGKSAFISAALHSYYQSTYSVLGSKATLRMERAYAVPKDRAVRIFLDHDDKITEILVEPADHFKLMLNDFCEEIAKGDLGQKKYEEDLLNQAKVLDAARISHNEKRVVYLKELT